MRLVDAIMRHTLHRLACNSVIAIQKPITQRSRNEIPSSEGTSGDGSSGGQNNQSSSGAAGGEKHKSSLNLSSGDAQVRKSSQQRSASKSGGGGTTGGTEEEEQVNYTEQRLGKGLDFFCKISFFRLFPCFP